MSSDADDDQVLPDSLQKLEIVPIYSQSQSACKVNNERDQNPFLTALSTTSEVDERITKDLFGPTCSNCDGSGASKNSKDLSNKSWRHRGSSIGHCIEHTINKQIHFKYRDKDKSQILSDKKLTILREPILKSIGRSMYHNGNQSKACCETKSNIEAVGESAISPDWFGVKAGEQAEGKAECSGTKCALALSTSKSDGRQGHSTADPNNVMIHRIQNWQLNDESTVDFRTLVNKCDNLTLSAHQTALNSANELHKSKNFQVLQANQAECVASLSGALDTSNPTPNGAGLNAMNTSLSSNSSNSSSCSQQARMNSSNCDVTIDELASYIEFQLHLPKPMSSNVYEAMFS